MSHMNIVETNIRSKLLPKSLNWTLEIGMANLSLNDFNLLYIDDYINFWYNNKEQRINKESVTKNNMVTWQREWSLKFRTCLLLRVNRINLYKIICLTLSVQDDFWALLGSYTKRVKPFSPGKIGKIDFWDSSNSTNFKRQ